LHLTILNNNMSGFLMIIVNLREYIA
jgi:hypothetical protein